MKGPTIAFGTIPWELSGPDDDPTARLLGNLTLRTLDGFECMLHVEAYAMQTDDDGIQRAIVWDDDVQSIHMAVGADGAFQTIPYEGRDYAVIASPYCT